MSVIKQAIVRVGHSRYLSLAESYLSVIKQAIVRVGRSRYLSLAESYLSVVKQSIEEARGEVEQRKQDD